MEKGKLSDIIVTNVINKGSSVIRPNFLANIKIIKDHISQNCNIDISIIDKQAFKTAIAIKPLVLKIMMMDDDKISNVAYIIKHVNLFTKELDLILGVKDDDPVGKLFVKTYFFNMLFTVICRIVSKQSISLNIPTVAVFMSPLFDELGLFTYVLSKRKILKINGYFRSSKFTRLLFDSLYSGGFQRPFSIESLAINIMYDTYIKLFDNAKIKSILRVDVKEYTNTLTFLFFMFAISIYSNNIKTYLNRSSKYLIGLYESNQE